MAETEEKSSLSNVPWVPLLAMLAAVAGLTTALLPSRSARPPAPIDSAVTVQGKVSARLWQDPLSVAREAASRPAADKYPPGNPLADEYDVLADVPARERPIVLVACEPGSPYAEDVERRVRDRAGVLHALAAEGYLPADSTTIHYMIDPNSGEVLPYESLHRLDLSERPAVLVIWLPDGVFDNTKGGLLHQLAAISQGLCDGSTTLRAKGLDGRKPLPNLRVLGPSSSPQYRLMLEGVTSKDDLASLRSLGSTQIYSCKAAAPEVVLADGISWVWQDKEAAKNSQHRTAVAVTRRARLETTDFRLRRTICPDDVIMEALWNEMHARRVLPNAHVAVVAEMDNLYGRSATWAFLRASQRANQSPPTFDLETLRRQTHNIETFTYMAGLDGALPKNALGAEEAKLKDDSSPAKKSDLIDDPTEGLSQVDYLRRLADEVAHKNEELKPDKKFHAVAVLGSDIYDKLQILRTLRPELPNTLFLTNNLDARFGHPDEWEETRNLLVASNYPLVPDPSWESEAPPFRDSLQAAMYAATRMALAEKGAGARWQGRPLLFEIGRHGAVQLTPYDGSSPMRVAFAGGTEWANIIGCLGSLAALGLLLWPGVSPPENAESAPPVAGLRHRFQSILTRAPAQAPSSEAVGPPVPTSGAHVHRRWTRSAAYVPLLVILAVTLTACRYYYQVGPAGGEPFAVLEGISIWPGDFLRTCALLLAIYFGVRTVCDLAKNSDDLEKKFCMLKRADQTAFRQRKLARGERPRPAAAGSKDGPPPENLVQVWRRRWYNLWPQADDYGDDQQRVHIGYLWLQYKTWGRASARLGRTTLMWVLYSCALLFLRRVLHEPNLDLPVRGSAAFGSITVLWLAGLSCIFVTLLVVDATELNWRSIRDLNQHRSDWQSAGVSHRAMDCCFEAHRTFLEAEDCADYLDIEFIARRSGAVNRLVYYPFILLSLLLAARWSVTDNYQWSPALLIGFGANAAWAIYCAIRLPLEAKAARRKSLKRLRQKLFVRRVQESTADAGDKHLLASKSSVAALEQVIKQIENMNRGAFVGLWEQPVVRAVLLPSGGAGLWALLQLLPH